MSSHLGIGAARWHHEPLVFAKLVRCEFAAGQQECSMWLYNDDFYMFRKNEKLIDVNS